MRRLRAFAGLLLLLLFWSRLVVGDGLLWRVAGQEGVSDSYLFGTMHSSDPRVTRLSSAAERAFAGTNSFTMEALLDPAAFTLLGQAMLISDGRTLADRVEPTLYRRLIEEMAVRGVPEQAVARLKPWAVYMTLSMPVDSGGGTALDLLLMQRALARSLPVYGLERIEEQLILFEGLSETEQVTLLHDLIVDYDGYQQLLERMIESYAQGDLDALERIARQSMEQSGDIALQQRLMSRLLDERNPRMVERMLPRLAEGGAFVAVGALHLGGEQGLISLLRERGYRVTAVE